MQTVRQIERLWNARQYTRLFRELISNRPESSFQLEIDAPTCAFAAALGIVRLDELSQPHVPLYATLVRAVLAAQEKDGGWGDVTATTLCLRALMVGRNTGGDAIPRGLKYLADLQKADGLWPKIPLRRMPGDPCLSAFVLYQLGDDPRFVEAVQCEATLNWFLENGATLETDARRLWDRAQLRSQLSKTAEPVLVWS